MIQLWKTSWKSSKVLVYVYRGFLPRLHDQFLITRIFYSFKPVSVKANCAAVRCIWPLLYLTEKSFKPICLKLCMQERCVDIFDRRKSFWDWSKKDTVSETGVYTIVYLLLLAIAIDLLKALDLNHLKKNIWSEVKDWKRRDIWKRKHVSSQAKDMFYHVET